MNGPRIRVCRPDQSAAASRLLRVPVVDRDGRHTPDCGGCGGQGEPEQCRYVVERESAGDAA
jgi:hypothetical protein